MKFKLFVFLAFVSVNVFSLNSRGFIIKSDQEAPNEYWSLEEAPKLRQDDQENEFSQEEAPIIREDEQWSRVEEPLKQADQEDKLTQEALVHQADQENKLTQEQSPKKQKEITKEEIVEESTQETKHDNKLKK